MADNNDTKTNFDVRAAANHYGPGNKGQANASKHAHFQNGCLPATTNALQCAAPAHSHHERGAELRTKSEHSNVRCSVATFWLMDECIRLTILRLIQKCSINQCVRRICKPATAHDQFSGAVIYISSIHVNVYGHN